MPAPPSPVFLIGAPRSGTRLLRDLLSSHPGVRAIPYDINYIWRKGSEDCEHDRISFEQVCEDDVGEIRRFILKRGQGAPWVVEKTVANAVRVAFVRSVFPEAVFVHLVRDGRDVVESIHRQWITPPDLRHVFTKAMSYPVNFGLGYACSYACRVIGQWLRLRAPSTYVWGVRYPGVERDLLEQTLLEVSARQWVSCVQYALQDLADTDPETYVTVYYEDLVADPRGQLERIGDLLNLAGWKNISGIEQVTTANVGKGRRSLEPAEHERVRRIIDSTLIELGYDE